MKKFLMAFCVVASVSASAQSIDPYRVGFQKPLEFSANTKLNVQKIKLKTVDGTWMLKDEDDRMFNCSLKLKVEGRDLAIKNKNIGEHYYGSMTADCDRLGKHFKTHYNRVLFLGLRNCIQSETVFDNDYCSIDVIAMRKEKDISLENGDLIKLTSKVKSYYVLKNHNAASYVSENNLIPEGLQTTTIDSYQVFKLSLGRQGQDFFIEKPSASLSSFMQGQNIYLNVSDDVLTNDKQLSVEIETSYNQIMQKLAMIPNGDAGVKEFEKQLPTILRDLSNTLKKMLAIITPVEFFRAELKIKELEKNVITMANTFKPAILNRDDFKREYASLSDEYNRYSNYVESRIQFKPVKVQQPQLPVEPGKPAEPMKYTNATNVNGALMVEYSFEGKQYLIGENLFFDKFIENSCMVEVQESIVSWVSKGSKTGTLKDRVILDGKFKLMWVHIEIDDTRSEVQICHNIKLNLFVYAVDKNNNLREIRLTNEEFRVNPGNLMPGLSQDTFYNAVLNMAF